MRADQPDPEDSFESATPSPEKEMTEAEIDALLQAAGATVVDAPPAEPEPYQPMAPKTDATPDLKRAKRRKPVYPDDPPKDRLPPHSLESEQGVLGCILLSPTDCLGQCIEKIRDTGAFYDLRHQSIYEELLAMYDTRTPIDLITLQQRLKDRGQLDQIGGIPYLSKLQDATPSAANLDYYLDVVVAKSFLRRTLNLCTSISSRVYESEGNVEDLSDELQREVVALTQERVEKGIRSIKQFVSGAMEAIEAFKNNKSAPGAIPTGYTDLDRMLLGGLKPGEMFVIAARPSVGKTSMAMNIVENIAIDYKLPVGVISLEMTAEALTLRMVCTRARVSLRNASEGYIAESDYPKLSTAAGKINSAPIYIDDTPAQSIMQIRAKARRMVQQFGIVVLVIDYMQLSHSNSKRAQENRQIEISEISSGCKTIAKELNIPVVVLSQLNREIEKNPNRKPRLSDLRESGSIEQDSDVVAFLYKPKDGDEEEEGSAGDSGFIRVNLLVAKQRNGPTGDVFFTFMKPYTRFESASRVSDDDVPDTRREPREQQQELT